MHIFLTASEFPFQTDPNEEYASFTYNPVSGEWVRRDVSKVAGEVLSFAEGMAFWKQQNPGKSVVVVNLTPHVLNILAEDGQTVVDIPRSGFVARLDETRESVAQVNDIAVTRPTYGAPYVVDAAGNRLPLPPAREDVVLIVSGMMLNHPDIATRSDVFSPGKPLRDENGRIIESGGLSAPVPPQAD